MTKMCLIFRSMGLWLGQDLLRCWASVMTDRLMDRGAVEKHIVTAADGLFHPLTVKWRVQVNTLLLLFSPPSLFLMLFSCFPSSLLAPSLLISFPSFSPSSLPFPYLSSSLLFFVISYPCFSSTFLSPPFLSSLLLLLSSFVFLFLSLLLLSFLLLLFFPCPSITPLLLTSPSLISALFVFPLLSFQLLF